MDFTQNKYRKSRTYIKYSECRHLLRAAVELMGYKLDKEGSSARDLKYKSEAFDDVIIVTGSTHYELFFNPRTSERGDVVQFLQHRSGSTVNPFADLQSNRQFVDQKLREASGYTLRTEYVEPVRAKSLNVPFLQETDKYVIEMLPESPNLMPEGVVNMLKRRGMKPEQFWDKDIHDSVGLLWLKNGVKRIPNLVFLWKNPETHATVGAQYKFYLQGPDGIVGKKVFVKGSDRTHSLWMTNMMGKSKLFVTEDVFDAVAHKLLVRNNSYGYCSTGGSVTPEQIRIIRNLIQTQKMQLVLGNDNDGAGMLSNLKIIADLKSYEYSKQNKTIQFTMQDGRTYRYDYSQSIEPLIAKVRELAAERNIQIEVPKRKDWNEDFQMQPSPTLNALQQEYQQGVGNDANAIEYKRGVSR